MRYPPLDPAGFEFDDRLWVMHCADGPMPRAAARAVRDFLPRETRPWTLRWQEDFQNIPARLRALGAKILGGRADDLTITATTSTGLVTVAQGVPWREGDEILIPEGEFPSNIWPWKALAPRGVTVRTVPMWSGHRAGSDAWETPPPPADVEPEVALLDALGPRTRLLAVSWVRFQDGLVLDLARLAEGCRKRGVHLVVDGIQGAGTRMPDLDGVAAFVTGGHKGLLAPQGLGLLWTEAEFRNHLVPSGSWLSVEDATDFRRPSTDTDRGWSSDGTRLEAGVPNLLGGVGLETSLEMIAEAGPGRIAVHIDRLVLRLLAKLGACPSWRTEAMRLAALHERGRVGAIVGLHHGRRGAAGLDAVLQRGFARGIWASVREGYLRIALHGWHTDDDIDRLVDWLADE